MHADYSCWLRIAREWRQGTPPYRVTYDLKSPWVFRWVQWVDSSRPEVSCYLTIAMISTAGAMLFRAALKPAFPRTATLIPLLLILWSGTSGTFHEGQTTEAVAMWCDVAAVSCWALAVQRASPGWAFAAGCIAFLTAALRQPAVVLLAAWLPFLGLLFGQYAKSVAWRTVAAACFGWLTMLVVFCVDCWAADTLGDFLLVTQRNTVYGSLARTGVIPSAMRGATVVLRTLLENPIAILLLTLTAAVFLRSSRRMRSVPRCWSWTAGIWLLAALASAWPGGRHYEHYYHFLWPALSLLATLWLAEKWRVTSDKRGQQRLIYGVAAGSLLAALLPQMYQRARDYRDYHMPDHRHDAMQKAVASIEQLVPPDTPLLVNVWGDWAELYWRASRPAPSFSIPYAVPPQLSDQWSEKTLAAMPAYIVWDGTPWPPIDGGGDPELAAQLTSMVDREFEEIHRIDELRILARRENRR